MQLHLALDDNLHKNHTIVVQQVLKPPQLDWLALPTASENQAFQLFLKLHSHVYDQFLPQVEYYRYIAEYSVSIIASRLDGVYAFNALLKLSDEIAKYLKCESDRAKSILT